MKTNYAAYSIFHIAKADFLQRIRSYYFLITLGICIFIMYTFIPPLDAHYKMLSLGNYRGFYNSAWIGTMVAMCAPFYALICFYLVNYAVKRDVDTGVGQIIATTPISKLQYLTGKFGSNFAVLLIIVLLMAAMTILMFFLRGETSHIELGKLLFPLVIFTVPTMFIIAAVALFLDSFTGLSKGIINILFFILWVYVLSSSAGIDIFGFNSGMTELKQLVSASHPDWNAGYVIGVGYSGTSGIQEVFTLESLIMSPAILWSRIFWMTMAAGLVLSAALFFKRFGTSKIKTSGHSRWFTSKKVTTVYDKNIISNIKYQDLPKAKSRFSYFSLVMTEIRFMLKGKSNLWLVISSGLFISLIFTKLEIAYSIELPLLWFFQIMTLSQLGCREVASRCNEYIFSASFALLRQLPATLIAAATVMYILALPITIRVLLSGNMYGFYAIAVGAAFVPAFAIAMGILTGGSKLFEVIFTIMAYGILNNAPFFDFVGALKGSKALGIAHYLLVITVIMVILAFAGRKRQILET